MPLAEIRTNPEHLAALEQWLKSYRPEELFDEQGALEASIAALAPKRDRRMGTNPHANGGQLLKDLRLPDFRSYAVRVAKPGASTGEATRVMGGYLRDVMKLNEEQRNFRVVGPDETASNRLGALFEATDRAWLGERDPEDEHLSPNGRVTYRRTNHANLHVRGYKEEGTTTTPFDMAVLNDIDRFHLVMDVADRVPQLGGHAVYLKQLMRDKRVEHKEYIVKNGDDLPDIRDWVWPY